jgi:hypothetical protein
VTDEQLDIGTLAHLLGEKPAQLYLWRHRGHLPPADGIVGQSPWWYHQTIARWLKDSEWARARGLALMRGRH